uniref:CIROZ beta domain-containing protein n=1 Tax=Xenopus tropicalis TaxID=8364 RepID=A0A803JH24_XENTR
MKNQHNTFWVLCLLFVMFDETFSAFPFGNGRIQFDPIRENSSDNIECFLDYMELWVPRKQINGLVLWLSQIMRFPVSLSSLDRSNQQLSRCKYFLDADADGNFLFRVHYTGCYVQTQVSRPIPLGNSNDQADWFFSLRGELVVSIEDASLIGVEVDVSNSSVTVSGLRGQLLDGIKILDRQIDNLHLWLAHGFYAYSLEASCPSVSQHPGEEVILHIPKQRVGLVKRGSYSADILTLKNLIVGQSANVTVTVTENKQFVVINIPSHEVLQRQDCYTTIGNNPGVQFFYCIDLVLEFTEMAYPINWTLENYYECSVRVPQMIQPKPTTAETFHKIKLELHTTPRSETRTALVITPTQDNTLASTSVTLAAKLRESVHSAIVQESSKTEMSASGYDAELDHVASGEYFNRIEGSGYYAETNISAALRLRKCHHL